MDKKALRKFAADNPAPAIPAGHGLLHAEQIGYILRTDIRIIDHSKTLVLFVYDRQQVIGGNPAPVWTMFHASNEYVTLARRPDGTTSWRTSAFENLGADWSFSGKCAFFSSRDERRVLDFLHDQGPSGITALASAQWLIQEKRCRERQLARERRTISRMRPLHALPRGLKPWIRREVMPTYFRCAHTSARKPVAGTCTSCGKESTLPHARHGSKIACPHCKRELTVQSIGKAGRHFDRDTVQVVESAGGIEVVVRIVKVYYNYARDRLMPEARIYENARIFVRAEDGKAKIEPYYHSYSKGTLTHWMPGERPVFFKYCANFEAETCGYIYARNLPDALRGTHWEYCPITPFYGHFREPMQMWPFLAAHVEHPRFEHLVKTGFYDLASDLAYCRIRDSLLDEAQGRTHRILRVAAEDVPFLRDLGADAETLRTFQQYASAKDRQRLLLWQREHKISRDVAECLRYVSAHRFMRYVDRQWPVLRTRTAERGGQRYRDMQAVVSEYRDYLEMCHRLDYNLRNSFVQFPKDLETAHDRVQRRVKIKDSIQLREDFTAATEAISRNLDFEADGMMIVVPSGPAELAAEGNALHHCVGGYADRVARRECIILFLRLASDPDKPFFTIEIRNRKAVQVRGLCNCPPTPEVQAVVAEFERQVLMAAA